MRRLFVAGNWKMNTTMASAQALASEVAAEVARSQPNVDVAVCPPFPYLIPVGISLANSPVMAWASSIASSASRCFHRRNLFRDARRCWLPVGCDRPQ